MAPSFEPLGPCLGAAVSDVDLAVPLSSGCVQAIRKGLLEHQVLFFRDQPLEPTQLVALAGHFGRPDVHAFGRHLPGHPEVGLLDQSTPERDGANRWHADSTFMPRPPFGAVLLAVQLPASGGDTCWASTVAAYDRLSAPLQRMLEGLTATHDLRGPLARAAAGGHSVGAVDEIVARWPPVSHPVVCRHPETGRKLLFVNSNFTTRIDGLCESESDALLRFLFDLMKTPELQVRFRWEVGSLALWDNRCTQHYAAADYRERRVMHRVTIAGARAPGPAASGPPA